MTLNYEKVWESMNSLEMVARKICSAREILDSAISALENGNKEKVETLMYATDEFLKYYLAEFDEKFKIAWKETVSKLHRENEDHLNAVLREKSFERKEYYEPSMPPWGHSDLEFGLANPTLTEDRVSNFPGEQYTEEEMSAMCAAAENSIVGATTVSMCGGNDVISFDLPQEKPDKVVRWQLPVECDGPSGEYYITFPDDLLEAANLKEGDDVEWVDNDDGSFILRKPKKQLNYDEAIAEGWTMTADGFWIKE
jgi:antitoxin component of MazEF toxin-antitoxin module